MGQGPKAALKALNEAQGMYVYKPRRNERWRLASAGLEL